MFAFAKKSYTPHPYSRKEDILSCLFHALGILLSIAGTVILIVFAAIYSTPWAIVSCSIFGASMITLYSASTLYHLSASEKYKQKLKKFDHIAIYYLIAGTYTPFMLVNIRGIMGWTIFSLVWSLAILGTILKLNTKISGTKAWSISLYLGMGWIAIFALKAIWESMPTSGFIFLLSGGLLYSLGVIFYVWKSKKYTHAIWHLFVLAGTIMHFFAVLYGSIFI